MHRVKLKKVSPKAKILKCLINTKVHYSDSHHHIIIVNLIHDHLGQSLHAS